MYRFKIHKEKNGAGIMWTATQNGDHADTPSYLTDAFVARFYCSDGQSLGVKSKDESKLCIDLFDSVHLPLIDCRLYKTSFSATDRSLTPMQQFMMPAVSWIHGLDMAGELMSHKYIGEKGIAWVPLCAPALHSILKNAFSGLLMHFYRSVSHNDWTLVIGGTLSSTYVLLGIRKKETDGIDIEPHPLLYGAQPSDLAMYSKYKIGMLYEVRHRKDLCIRLIDVSLITLGIEGCLKGAYVGKEYEMIEAALDLIRGALVVSGMVNGFVMELDSVECIQESLREFECSVCRNVQRKTRPTLCGTCMQSCICKKCCSQHEETACKARRWNLEINLCLPR